MRSLRPFSSARSRLISVLQEVSKIDSMGVDGGGYIIGDGAA